MHSRGPLVLSALALLLASAACSGFTRGSEAADRAIVVFHEQFNQGRFGEIWDGAGAELKQASSREDFSRLLGKVRQKLGDVTGSTGNGWKVNARIKATYVDMRQATTFANGKAVESFHFVLRDGQAALLGYNISSPDLLL